MEQQYDGDVIQCEKCGGIHPPSPMDQWCRPKAGGQFQREVKPHQGIECRFIDVIEGTNCANWKCPCCGKKFVSPTQPLCDGAV